MVFIETPLDATHEANAFWIEPPEALMLASFKVSVIQVVTLPFVTVFVLSHLTEAHYIPAMVSDEPTPHDNHHSSEEEEEAPRPGSPADSWQGDPSSHAEYKACRDNKRSRKEEVVNKENQTKRKAKTKRAETSKEDSPTPVLSVSHGSMVIDCLDGSMITIYREHEGHFMQTGWAPPSKEKPVVLANSKNSPIRGWGGLSKMSKKMSIIELCQLGQDLFDFSDLTWGHPLTHSSTIGIFKQNQIISISSNFIKLVILPDPTHWPTQPPIHQHTYHGWGVSTNHKSSNRIESSWLGQDLFNC